MRPVHALRVADSVLDLIGNTPSVRMRRIVGPADARLYVKLEWYNPGGSVKDRMALYIFEHAEAAGRIKKDKVILEATSGNTGIALAMIAAAKGYKAKIVMPESVSVERRKIIKAFGADLVLSPAEKGTWGAIELKQKMLKEDPDLYVDLNQFSDPANILAHYQTTGREIFEQLGGCVDIVVVGVGTSGTAGGVSLYMRQNCPGAKIVGVLPELGVSVQGLRNPNEPYPTRLYRDEYFDEIVYVKKADIKDTYRVARDVARKEGLLIGMSSAAIMRVAIDLAKKAGKGKVVVAILPDSGMKYLSTELFDG